MGPSMTYAPTVRPYVEALLRAHFLLNGGRGHGGPLPPNISVTQSMCTRAETLSHRDKVPCAECSGRGYWEMPMTSGERRRHRCEDCEGTGEVKAAKAIEAHDALTTRCRDCKGSGQFLTPELRRAISKGGWRYLEDQETRVWVENPYHDPDAEAACCVACRGQRYRVTTRRCPVSPTGDEQFNPPAVPMAEASAVSRVLERMHQAGHHECTMVLELTFGEVARKVERELCECPDIVLWPLTDPGRALMGQLGIPAGKAPHKALAKAAHGGDIEEEALAELSQVAAIRLLEEAIAQLCASDTDQEIQKLAERARERGSL